MMRMLAAEPEWHRLFFEFARARRAQRGLPRRSWWSATGCCASGWPSCWRSARERLGIEPVVPPEQIAAMTFAMANGMALERLLEPEAVPDTLFGEMMATFFTGLRARAGVPPPPAGPT